MFIAAAVVMIFFFVIMFQRIQKISVLLRVYTIGIAALHQQPSQRLHMSADLLRV